MKSIKSLDWPPCHATPLYLTNKEIADPFLALADFFDRYDLIILRFRLKQWLEDGLMQQKGNASTTLDLYHELLRLAEAAFLLHTQHKVDQSHKLDLADTNDTASTKHLLDAFAPGPGSGDEDSENDDLLEIAPRFEELAYRHPELILKELFRFQDTDELLDTCERWRYAAMMSDNTKYAEAEYRAAVLPFLDSLPDLLEALNIIRLFGAFEENEIHFPSAARLRRDYEPLVLREKAAIDPLSVVRDFFQHYTLKFAHREMWALLEAVLFDEYAMTNSDKKYALSHYRACFAAMDAAYRIYTNYLSLKQAPQDDEN